MTALDFGTSVALSCLLGVGGISGGWPAAQSGSGASDRSSVAGQVEQDGMPAAGVVLVLTGRGLSRPLVAITDPDGRFRFEPLVGGEFLLAVRKPAHVISLVNGVTWLGDDVPVAVSDGRRTSVSVTVARGGVIEGVVRDPFGSPLVGAAVSVFRKSVAAASMPPLPSIVVTTNRQGAYRAYGLRPGEYLVQAVARLSAGSRGLELVNEADYRQVEQAAGGSRALPPPASTPEAAVEYLATYFG
jgi:hypothetical protein